MADPIAEAFVVIRPDFTLFKAQLEAGVKKATSTVQAQVRVAATGSGATGASATVKAAVVVDSAAAVTSAKAATVAIEETAVATGAATAASVELANANAAVASANAAVARTTLAYNTVLGKEGADAEKTALALANLTAATARQTAAQERLALITAGTPGHGFLQTTQGANALRGAFIGLSRITPLTVFGLQASGVAAIIAGTAIAASVVSVAKFEDQLNTLQAVTKATNAEMAAIRAQAIALGNDTQLAGISASDAAIAMTELTKAGISVKDSMAAARGVLELAGASGMKAGEAAQVVATQLNAFKLSGDQAARVTNLLANASIAAQGDITDFAFAFQQVSSVAAQANLSIEQQTALLTELAKAGIKGADAGTSLRTFLLRLIPTTKQASEFTKVLGVSLDGNKTEGEQLGAVIEQYRKQLMLLTPIQRVNVLNQIFGQDAYRASTIIFSQNREELDKLIRQLSVAGGAEDLNAAKAKGLGGAFRGLASQLETIGVQFGELVDGPLEKLIRGFSTTITQAGRVIGKIKDLGEIVSGWKPITLPITIVIDLLDKIPGPIKTALKEMAKFGLPGFGPFLVGLDAIDALTGGAGKKTTDIGAADFASAAHSRPGNTIQKTYSAAAKALQKKVQNEIDRQNGVGAGGGSTNDPDVTPSHKLLVAQEKARLSGSLQRELAADKDIRSYFQNRLDHIKGKGKQYLQVLTALRTANDAVVSIQGQIASDAQSARDKAEAARKKEEQARKDAVEKAKAGELARFRLSQSELDLAIQAAGLTESKVDDKRTLNRKIDSISSRIAALNKIKKKTTEEKQAIVDLKSERLSLRAQIKGLNDSSSGFSLADLFKESINQLNQFGSNVSTGVTIGGGARAALAGALSAANPNMTPADRAKLIATARTNDLLDLILAAILNNNSDNAPVGHNKGTVRDPIGRADFATSAHVRHFTAVSRGGWNS